MARDRRIDAVARRIERVKLPEQSQLDFTIYRDDPVGFCTDILGVKSATSRSTGREYQFDILRDVAAHPRVGVISGHGVGKSHNDAEAAIWWVRTHPYSKVIIVAPEFTRQVRHALWGEINKLVARAKVPLGLEVLAGRVAVDGYGPEWSILGMPATEPSRIEGAHAEGGLLLILDECKGVGADVYDALQGALTGGSDSRLLVTSTPGGGVGPFHKIITRGGDDWKIHHLSSEDSSLVSPEWCKSRERDWGRESQLYQMRVLGRFAEAEEGVLFPLSMLEAARGREVEVSEKITLGVDVARSVAGDKNAIAIARGGRLERVITWHSDDTMQVVGRVVQEAVKVKPNLIRVDVGGPGGGVVDRCKQLGGMRVEAVYFGGAATDNTRFRNRRAELFWRMREELEKGTISLPDDDELIADLASLRYGFDANGRILLEAKDECRRRLGRSPDRGDSAALALCKADSRYLGPARIIRFPI